jgi:hypothetical protein
MTLATICRSVFVRGGVGRAVPSAWAGNEDQTAREIVALASEGLATVARAHDWQSLRRTHSVALANTDEQDVAFPADYGRPIPGTTWITGDSTAARGPITDVEYEALRQDVARSPTPVFRVSGGVINLLGGATLGSNLTLRYMTGHAVLAVDGVTTRADWLQDTDTARVNERLIVLATLTLWRDSKGLPADLAARQYAAELSRAIATDRGVGVMDLAGARSQPVTVGRQSGMVLDVGGLLG